MDAPKSKKQKPSTLDEVTLILEDAKADNQAVSPFSSGNLMTGVFGTVPLSQPFPRAPVSSQTDIQKVFDIFDKERTEEVRALKHKLLKLQQNQGLATPPPPPSMMPPPPSLATTNSEILDFFKSMEAARAKSAAEASALQVAARKEDLKCMETLSKRLTRKDGQDRHNLKQTAIILGTAEALSALSEGCSRYCVVFCVFVRIIIVLIVVCVSCDTSYLCMLLCLHTPVKRLKPFTKLITLI